MSNYSLEILSRGFQNLINRKGSISIDEMETEINYQTCRYIIENYKNEVVSVSDINSINTVVDINIQKFSGIINDFLRVGNQIFPEHWQKDKDSIFVHLICANLSWSGMWEYLVSYFLKTHGEDIDESEKESLIFYSQKHLRYENNAFINESEVERNVNMTFFNQFQTIMISIEPTLSAKKGYLVSNQNSILIYRGDDPDYRFTIYLDKFEEVDKFILELTERKLRIEYF